jgi:hypothetical protein
MKNLYVLIIKMALGNIISMIGKAAPKIGKAFGMINQATKSYGQLSNAGRTFGTIANQASGGKLAQSKFGKGIENLVDKADAANNKISSLSGRAESSFNSAVDKLKKY